MVKLQYNKDNLLLGNKCYLNCLVGSPLGLILKWITEVHWFFWMYNEIQAVSWSRVCFCEGGNVIVVVKPGEAYGSFQSKVSMCCHEGGGHWNGSEVNPLEVSRGLKEGRIRLVGECNQCDYITEYDQRGREERREWRDHGLQKLFKAVLRMPKRKGPIHNHKCEIS